MRRTIFVLMLYLALCGGAWGRDARSVADWLCSRIFEGDGVTLGLACDGFFGLRIAPKGKPVQNITGLWRLEPDGIGLSLLNLQDSEIKMSVGRDGLHAILGKIGRITLLPSQTEKASFRVTGMLELKGDKAVLKDAASGRAFFVKPDPAAKDGKFAVVEVAIGPEGVQPGKMIRHSGAVPRFFERKDVIGADFGKDVCNRFWLLPHLPGVDKAALRFASPQVNGKTGDKEGSFEISGRGLRLEGGYILAKDKLTISASRASLRNLEIIGAGEIARTVLGEFDWRLSPAGLELLGADRRILLLAL